MFKFNNMFLVAFLLASCMVTVMMHHLQRAETEDHYSSRFHKILRFMQGKVNEATLRLKPTELKREKLVLANLLLHEMGKFIEVSRAKDKTSDYWYMRPG